MPVMSVVIGEKFRPKTSKKSISVRIAGSSKPVTLAIRRDLSAEIESPRSSSIVD